MSQQKILHAAMKMEDYRMPQLKASTAKSFMSNYLDPDVFLLFVKYSFEWKKC